TTHRERLETSNHIVAQIGTGGLSGAPLCARSTEMIRDIRTLAGPDLIIIGVGGILNPSDALEKLDAGADLVQIYTGLIYQGPALIKQIKQQLIDRLT
ncbi:MAG: dihydroorotate dehydrogenase (quinone), partial [Saprospiraceae bacterium]|nr:dihydroorotate dehydrogenase (quinone) [Saprospiraceae bacterium]